MFRKHPLHTDYRLGEALAPEPAFGADDVEDEDGSAIHTIEDAAG